MDPGVRNALDRASKLCDEECDEEAQGVILDALGSYPENPDLRTMLGKIQARLQREDEAEVTLRGVLKDDPLHEDASCALGRLLDQSLRTDEAEKVYRRLLTESPASHCALDDLCRLLLAEGQCFEALEVARAHANRFPDCLEAYDGLRYLLAIVEDELCEGYISESTDNETLEKLTVNLLEQFDVMMRIKKNVGPLSGMEEPLATDMQEEYLRIVGELDHLSRVIDERVFTLPTSLSRQLLNAVKEGSARIEGF
ncbi:MAG: tetratricopeptide repeat protein [Candidatus Thorarchaeota archaeon]